MEATQIRRMPQFSGYAALYKLARPVWSRKHGEFRQFVIISGVVHPFSGGEVLVFPSNEEGEIDLAEITGIRGDTSHDAALAMLDDHTEESGTEDDDMDDEGGPK